MGHPKRKLIFQLHFSGAMLVSGNVYCMHFFCPCHNPKSGHHVSPVTPPWRSERSPQSVGSYICQIPTWSNISKNLKPMGGTLPKTNSSHLKMYGWDTIVSFWEGLFSGAIPYFYHGPTISYPYFGGSFQMLTWWNVNQRSNTNLPQMTSNLYICINDATSCCYVFQWCY